MIKCNTCANLIPNDSEFCPFCGNKVIHIVEEPLVQGDSLLSIQPDVLIKRAFLFIEEGNFDKADTYIEAVLNQEPENAEAYLAKLLMDLRVSTVEELSNVSEPFDDNINYKRALRYGDEELKEKLLNSHNDCIKSITKKTLEEKEDMYNEAKAIMLDAENFQISYSNFEEVKSQYSKAENIFNNLADYKDSVELLVECEKNLLYKIACFLMDSNSKNDIELAIEKFEKIGDWKDSTERISLCNKKIDELNKELEKDRKKEILIAFSALGVILLVVVVAIICDSIYY